MAGATRPVLITKQQQADTGKHAADIINRRASIGKLDFILSWDHDHVIGRGTVNGVGSANGFPVGIIVYLHQVRHADTGGFKANQSVIDDDIADLVAFLHALTGETADTRPLGRPDIVPSGLPVD